jgi:hypothetical protein
LSGKTGSPTSKKDAKIKEEKWGRCWTNTRKTLENRIRRSYDSLSFSDKSTTAIYKKQIEV